MFEGRNTSLARNGYLETGFTMAKCSSDFKEIARKPLRAENLS